MKITTISSALSASTVAMGRPAFPYDENAQPPFKPEALAQPNMSIFNQGGVDEGAFYPPSEVTLYSRDQITALRDFCNELLAEHLIEKVVAKS